eukprot:9497367-Pyramimonas_sp.AAC.1
MCPLCDQPDSVHHRLWHCVACESQRTDSVPDEIIHAARSDRLSCYGLGSSFSSRTMASFRPPLMH